MLAQAIGNDRPTKFFAEVKMSRINAERGEPIENVAFRATSQAFESQKSVVIDCHGNQVATVTPYDDISKVVERYRRVMEEDNSIAEMSGLPYRWDPTRVFTLITVQSETPQQCIA